MALPAHAELHVAPEPIRNVLVPVDLTPLSDRVLARVALLHLADDACITVLHVVPRSLPGPEQHQAERDARKLLHEARLDLAKELPRRSRVTTVVSVGTAASVIAEQVRATSAELVVLGRGGGRLREVFLGSTAERVIRKSKVPVLAVQQRATRPYRRPAIAIDHDDAAAAVVVTALRVLVPPYPRISVLHAYENPYGRSVYPSVAQTQLDDMRSEMTARAGRKIRALFDKAIKRARIAAPPHALTVKSGSPRMVIEKAVARADYDLLALGTHARSGIAQAFLGTIAGDVLRTVACDVLVVPPRK